MALHRNDNLENLVPRIDKTLREILECCSNGAYDWASVAPDRAVIAASRLIEARYKIAGTPGGTEDALIRLEKHITGDKDD